MRLEPFCEEVEGTKKDKTFLTMEIGCVRAWKRDHDPLRTFSRDEVWLQCKRVL